MEDVVTLVDDLESIENRAMASAMATSLEEEHSRKAAEKPLREWPASDLQERFKDSIVMQKLHRLVPKSQHLFDVTCLDELIETLEFERQARHWFPGPGTLEYFREISDFEFFCGRAGAQAKSQAPSVCTAILQAHSKVQEAKSKVFQMPTTENEVPPIFRTGNMVCHEDMSDVEILECAKDAGQNPLVHKLDW